MKKIFACLAVLTVFGSFDAVAENQKPMLDQDNSFVIAKAVKLGRGNSTAYATGTNLNTGGSSKIAKECDSSCSKCDTTTGKCLSCPSGKRLLDSKCVDYCYEVYCASGYTTETTSNGCCCKPQ